MRKKKREGLWQWDFQNRKTNFSNSIDENVGKKKERIGEKNFPYLDYGNSIAENVKKKEGKKGEKDYGNGIAEIGKKNFPCFGNTIAVNVNKK